MKALKPDPTGLLRAAARLDGNVERCLYVGDSVTDGEAAQRAGVPCLQPCFPALRNETPLRSMSR